MSFKIPKEMIVGSQRLSLDTYQGSGAQPTVELEIEHYEERLIVELTKEGVRELINQLVLAIS